MKVLIVGCGAVGQVYGLALQEAGVELGLYDRPETVGKLRKALDQGGLPLFQWSGSRRQAPLPGRLERGRVLADAAEAREFAPDQVWFATPSPVYYSDWFRDFLQAVPAARVACFVPEGARPEFLPPGPAGRLVFGGTTFMAWQGDLEGGGGRAEAVNFWRPPLAIPLVGEREACREVGRLLKQAGFRVSYGKPGSHAQAGMTAAMTAFVAGLELSGWSLQGFGKSPWLGRSAGAARQAILGQLPAAGAFTRPLLSRAVLALAFRLVILFLPRLVPFDLQKYLRFHYTKTRQQSLALLELFAADAARAGRPADELRGLLEALSGDAPVHKIPS